MTIFDELFGASSSRFLTEAWATAHSHFAASSAAPRVCELADLPELAERDEVIARHRGTIKAIRSTRDAFRSKPIDRAEVADAYRGCETIVFERISDSVPQLASIRDDLATCLGFSSSLLYCNLYVTPPGGGVIKHFDDQDVWVIGVCGAKTFRVAPNRDALNPRLGSSLPNAFTPMPDDATSVEITPGKVLYLSPGLWHATSSESGAHTLSFGLRRPPWHELLEQSISRELLRSVEWREPVERLAPLTPALLARAANHLADLSQVVRRLDPRELVLGTSRDPIRECTLRVTRNASIEIAATTILVEQEDGMTELECDESVHALARHIASAGQIQFATLYSQLDWSEGDLVYALQGLIEAGVVEAR